MANDFIPNKLSFDVKGFTGLFEQICNTYLDILSDHMQDIVRNQIVKNGNGSDRMKLSTISEVKETKREITSEKIQLDVGIDLESLRGMEAKFVKVSVVLHGNMKSSKWTWRDARVMYTKPGQATWDKHVLNKAVHVPKKYAPRALPGFAQQDKMDDIVSGVTVNAEKEIEKHVNDFINNLNKALSQINWSAFVIVG